jgi:mono/diheme cytochrome c family protein
MPPPPNTPLTQEQIATIYAWIQAGAKNTTNCEQNTCDTTNVTYSNQISAILSNYCTGCHNTNNASGGWDLSTYSGVQACINAGRFWGSVNWDTGYSAMPKNGNKLSDCDLASIKKWLNAGAPNN